MTELIDWDWDETELIEWDELIKILYFQINHWFIIICQFIIISKRNIRSFRKSVNALNACGLHDNTRQPFITFVDIVHVFCLTKTLSKNYVYHSRTQQYLDVWLNAVSNVHSFTIRKLGPPLWKIAFFNHRSQRTYTHKKNTFVAFKGPIKSDDCHQDTNINLNPKNKLHLR